MTNAKQKLELNWVGKDKRPQLEPRILRPDDSLSHVATERHGAGDRFDNILVQGDNLLAVRALETEFAGQVQCIYIDPPYNTGSAFEVYNDGLEHSLWLSLLRDRIELLWSLLSPEGSLWVSIDDRESAYLRVLLDEICGRQSFVAAIVWQKRYSRENRGSIGDAHEYILTYAKDIDAFADHRNAIPIEGKSAEVYKNPNNDPRGPWRAIPMTAQGYRPNQMYEITTPSGAKHKPPEGRCWSMIRPRYDELLALGRIYFGKDGSAQPSVIRYLSEVEGITPWTWWPHDEVGHTDEAKKESQALFGRDAAFPTPKPERLIKRILEIATDPGDLVLDSFAGSGTTGAVAHKMGRRWIMIEQGDHAVTHIVPRLKKVVDGEEFGGVTEATGWKGGGGFRFYRLAPSLLEKDQFDNWVISKKYDAAMLAEAMCKHMGFTYAPSTQHYWMQGYSSERDFIYTTTQSLPHDQLRALSEAVGPDRSLLVCCKAFQGKHVAEFKNLTVKKIPLAILHRCEWGKDDYSVSVAALAPPEPPPPVVEADGDDGEPEEPPRPRRKRKKKAEPTNTLTLDFDGEDA